MSRLTSRLDALERRARPPCQIVVVLPATGGEAVPGGVTPLLGGAGICLTTPPDYETDPEAGLSAEQRALIRPEDRLIMVTYGAPETAR